MRKIKAWTIKNEDGSEAAEILIYNYIADEDSFWFKTAAADALAEELMRLGGKPLNIRINSYGGSLFAGHAMMSALKRYPGTVTAYIDGIAASAATLVAMGAAKVIMPSNSMMMIHNPSYRLNGAFEKKELDKLGEVLEEMKQSAIAAYQTKTNLSAEAIAEIMDDETWMTAATAKKYGFADEVRGLAKFDIENDNLVSNGVSMPLNSVPGRVQLINYISNKPKEVEHNLNDKEKTLFEAVKEYFGKPETPATAVNTAQPASSMSFATLQPMTMDALKTNHPDVYKQAKMDGAQEERERIQAINNIAGALPKDLVNKAINSGQTAEELALEACKATAQAGQAFMAAAKTDAQDSNVDAVTATGSAPGAMDEKDEREALVSMMVKSVGGAAKNG